MGIAEQRFASSSSAEHLRVTVEVALAVAVVVVAEASAWWACGSHTSVQQRRLTGLEWRYWATDAAGARMEHFDLLQTLALNAVKFQDGAMQ